MAEAQVPEGRRVVRKPRRRASAARKSPARRLRRHFGVGLTILLIIAALGLLAAGLIAASLTIFGRAGATSTHSRAGAIHPTSSPSVSSLVGSPINGTIVAVSVSENLVAIQPSAGAPIQAFVNASSKITRGGAAAPLSSLIPGEAVVVTFSQGPNGTLLVAVLNDVESLPTNTPSPTFTPTPQYSATPSPTTGPGASPQPPITPNPPGSG